MAEKETPPARKWFQWAEVEASPEYQAADEDGKSQTLLNWRDHTLDARNEAGDWTPEHYQEFQLFTEHKRRSLSGNYSEEAAHPAHILGELQVLEEASKKHRELLFGEVQTQNSAKSALQFAKLKTFNPFGDEGVWRSAEEKDEVVKAKHKFWDEIASSEERVNESMGAGKLYNIHFADRVTAVLDGKQDAVILLGKAVISPKFYEANDKAGAVAALREDGAATPEVIAEMLAGFDREREMYGARAAETLSKIDFGMNMEGGFDEWRARRKSLCLTQMRLKSSRRRILKR